MVKVAAGLRLAWLIAIVPPLALGDDAEEDAEAFDDQDIDEDTLSGEQLRKLHAAMDRDGNGRLSLQETIEYAKDISRSIAGKDVGAIVEEIDTSRDGMVSLEEHMADLRNQADGGDEEELKEMEQRMHVEKQKFLAADNNQDQMLDKTELTGLFYPETHDGVLSVTIQETLRQKDKNGDSKLSPQEFWEADELDGDDGQLSEEENSDFEKLDLDKDGFLNMEEIRSWESGSFHTEDAMKKMFELADKDSDMHLSSEELEAAREEISLSDAQYHLIEWAEHHEL